MRAKKEGDGKSKQIIIALTYQCLRKASEGMGSTKKRNKLKLVRQQHYESREELAAVLGVTASSVSKWEIGVRNPRDCIKRQIAEHYKTSVAELFFSE